MTPHQQGIIELVGVFKERFGLLITHEQADWIVSFSRKYAEMPGWKAYGGFSGPTDREVKNG